jgi:uncharacterized protein involved in type VI secretion and phage assembly
MRTGGPKRASLDQVHYGLYYGIVTANVDPESLNRVKVRFPWLDGGDRDESYWAQLVTPMEGNRFGWYVLPDIDDVVVVMFIAGDFSQPVLLGGVWSTTDLSPEPNEDGANNFRGYRSRTGARLIMDDSSAVKVSFIDHKGERMIGIGDFAGGGAGPNKVDVFKPAMAGAKGVSISAMKGKLEVTCKDGVLKVTAGQSIKINAQTTITVKAGGATSLEGSSTTTMTSSAQTNLDGAQVKIN